MNMDFEKSFNYITADKNWKSKLMTGGALSFLAFIILFLPLIFIKHLDFVVFVSLLSVAFIISLILNFATFGYFALTAHNRIHNNENFLPEWKNFGKLIAAGCKVVIGHVLFFLPFALIGGVILLVIMFPEILPDYHAISVLITLILIAAGLFAYFILYMLLVIFYFLLFGSFLTDLKILSFLNFKKAAGFAKNNIVNYLIFWLLVIVVSLIVQFLSVVLIFTIIGALLIPWLIFYSYLVSADIIAQFVKTSKE